MSNTYSPKTLKKLPDPSGSFAIPSLDIDTDFSSRLAVGFEQQYPKRIYFSLVIPTFNEQENIVKIVKLLVEILDGFCPNEYEIIIVDDNSSDDTLTLVKQLILDYSVVRLMHRTQESGLSSAVLRGWQMSQGEILGVIDADLQHPPDIIEKLLTAVLQGADLAVASRHTIGGGVSEWSLIRRALSRGAQILGLVLVPNLFGCLSDPMSGYFVVKRSAVENVPMNPLGYKVLLEVVGRGKITQIAEVGYIFQERAGGQSKVTLKQYWEYIQHLFRLRSCKHDRGIRKLHNQNLILGRFIRFGLVGLTGVFVDMTILYLLSDPTTLALGLTRSKLIAAEVAIINNFLWNDYWTFQDLTVEQNRWRQKIKRMAKFNIICLMGLAINIGALNLLFNILGINRYIANFIAIGIVTFWNFWINFKLNWRVTDIK